MSKESNKYDDPYAFEEFFGGMRRNWLREWDTIEGNSLRTVVRISGTGDQVRKLDGFTTQKQFPDFVPSIMLYKTRGGEDTGGIVFHTTRIVITSVIEPRSENVQIDNVFSHGDYPSNMHVSFYGSSPRAITVNGSLYYGEVNAKKATLFGFNDERTPDETPDMDWYNNFLYLYENMLRGSKCVALGMQARIAFAYQWRQGYVVNFDTSHNVSMPGEVQFTMNMILTGSGTYRYKSDISSVDVIDRSSFSSYDNPEDGSMFRGPNDDAVFYYED